MFKKLITLSMMFPLVLGFVTIGCSQEPSYDDILNEEDTIPSILRPLIVLETNQGKIEIELWTDVAPNACENMMKLIEKGYYNGVIFHRVIKNFMIQGGDPTGTGRGGNSIWGRPFRDEVNPKYTFDKPGLLAMANSGPNTNGSQFFITTKPTPWLNMKHTIFGEVISGYDVVEAIENTKVGAGDKPLEKQIILKAYIEE